MLLVRDNVGSLLVYFGLPTVVQDERARAGNHIKTISIIRTRFKNNLNASRLRPVKTSFTLQAQLLQILLNFLPETFKNYYTEQLSVFLKSTDHFNGRGLYSQEKCYATIWKPPFLLHSALQR